jgi:hypothetical protein
MSRNADRRFRSEREFWERVAARCSSRAMPVPPSLKPMMVSSCSIPSIRGSEAAPTREGSSPSSFANVLGIGKAELLLAKKYDELCKSTYPPLAPSINNTVAKDQPTSCTHEIPRSEFLDNCWVGIPAVQTDETDREVGCKSCLLSFRGRSKREGFGIGH